MTYNLFDSIFLSFDPIEAQDVFLMDVQIKENTVLNNIFGSLRSVMQTVNLMIIGFTFRY
jgi:hypothetical protein